MIPVTASWLRQKYETEMLDCVQIAAIVGRNPKTVWNWLKASGIATRPRGSNAPANLLRGRRAGFRLSEEQKDTLRAARFRDGHFPKQPDGRPYWTGKSGQDHPTWRGGATPERQAFYGTQEWKRACVAVWSRAKARCERCGRCHRRGDEFDVHHIVPFIVKRLRAAVHNLALLCGDCHRFVHSPANGDREFLPPFATLPINGRLISISYSPKHRGRLAAWLTK